MESSTIPLTAISLWQQAKWAADDFQNRIPIIMRDENAAAGKIDGAIKGC